MSKDFIPSKESELATWSNTFQAALTTLATQVGVSSAQVTAFTSVNSAWISAYNAASADVTRTKPILLTKDAAKRAMVVNARMLAGIIQKSPGTTNAMRSQLGITVPAARTPIPVPGMSPVLEVKTVVQNTVTLSAHSTTSPRRGKPAGVAGMSVFSFVGETPPVDIVDWKFEGSTARTLIDVVFPTGTGAFSKVWLTAFYTNAKGQSGIATTPISTNLGSWLVSVDNGQASALDQETPQKRAA